MASLPAQRAGIGHTLEIQGESVDEKITRNDIAFGDVWLCSGQSNMEWRLFYNPPVNNAELEKQNANFPAIRFVTVPHVATRDAQDLADIAWKPITPQTVGDVSAVGYFFGRDLHQRLNIPIGLIDSSWGGSQAEPWASLDALEDVPELKTAVAQARQPISAVPFDQQMTAWWKANDSGSTKGYANFGFDDSGWKVATLPGVWENSNDEELKGLDGVVWYRREIEIPDGAAGRDLTLELGAIDDADATYWNGELIGETNDHQKLRSYVIPANKVRFTRNTLAVRVLDTGGGGGFTSPPERMKLSTNEVSIPLDGAWRLKRESALADLPARPVDPNRDLFNAPSGIYNGMIAPLLPYTLKGAIWYQGESNASRAEAYQSVLPALIGDWRKRFKSGDFPFYIVQLAGFNGRDENPTGGENSWAAIRESQALVAQKVKNSGLAVTIDIGDERDIHPSNKQDVGKRLALLALAKTYDQNVEFEAPKFRRQTLVGNALRLDFETRSPLDASTWRFTGDTKRMFVIAGEDKKWHWGEVTNSGTRIEDGRLVPFLDVSSTNVSKPVAVRYAWTNFPTGAILTRSGLPLAPFRTDNWK